MKKLTYEDTKIHNWYDLEQIVDHNFEETSYTINKAIKKTNANGRTIFLLSGVVIGLGYILNKLYEKVDRLVEDFNQYKDDNRDKDFEYDFTDDDDLK